MDTITPAPSLGAAVRLPAERSAVSSRYAWYAAIGFYAVLLTAVRYVATTQWHLAAPERMATFTAAEPFQQRVLVPLIVWATAHILPWLNVKLLFAVAEVFEWALLVLVAYWALDAFSIGRSEVVRRWLALTVMLPVAMHLIVPDLWFQSIFLVDNGVVGMGKWGATRIFRYVYDLPAGLLTLAVAVALWQFAQAYERRWLAVYLGLLALAAINRETIVWMLPAFVAVCWRMPDRKLLAQAVLAQAAILACILGFTLWIFSDIPNSHGNFMGTSYENHLVDNLSRFANPLYAITYFARFALGLYLPVIVFHRYLDPVLKQTLIWFGIPLIASAVFFGRIVEQRVVIEVIPLIWLAAVQTINARSKEERLLRL